MRILGLLVLFAVAMALPLCRQRRQMARWGVLIASGRPCSASLHLAGLLQHHLPQPEDAVAVGYRIDLAAELGKDLGVAVCGWIAGHCRLNSA